MCCSDPACQWCRRSAPNERAAWRLPLATLIRRSTSSSVRCSRSRPMSRLLRRRSVTVRNSESGVTSRRFDLAMILPLPKTGLGVRLRTVFPRPRRAPDPKIAAPYTVRAAEAATLTTVPPHCFPLIVWRSQINLSRFPRYRRRLSRTLCRFSRTHWCSGRPSKGAAKDGNGEQHDQQNHRYPHSGCRVGVCRRCVGANRPARCRSMASARRQLLQATYQQPRYE